jgi:hypothetical protein
MGGPWTGDFIYGGLGKGGGACDAMLARSHHWPSKRPAKPSESLQITLHMAFNEFDCSVALHLGRYARCTTTQVCSTCLLLPAVVDVFLRTWGGPLALVSPVYSGAYASPDDDQPYFARDMVSEGYV